MFSQIFFMVGTMAWSLDNDRQMGNLFWYILIDQTYVWFTEKINTFHRQWLILFIISCLDRWSIWSLSVHHPASLTDFVNHLHKSLLMSSARAVWSILNCEVIQTHWSWIWNLDDKSREAYAFYRVKCKRYLVYSMYI